MQENMRPFNENANRIDIDFVVNNFINSMSENEIDLNNVNENLTHLTSAFNFNVENIRVFLANRNALAKLNQLEEFIANIIGFNEEDFLGKQMLNKVEDIRSFFPQPDIEPILLDRDPIVNNNNRNIEL